MNRRLRRSLAVCVVAGASGWALAGTATADVEHPPAGTPPNQFATQDKGCLGGLRSAIARGEITLPDGTTLTFDGEFNPGDHFGTVQEAQFLAEFLVEQGVIDSADQLDAFCALFAPGP
jgi:hypothetical protein